MSESTEPASAPSKAVTAVTFALPDESRDFVARLAGVVRGPGRLATVSGALAGRRIVVVHTGVGDTPAGRKRLQAAVAEGAIRRVISAGFAGGLAPDLQTGHLVLSQNRSAPAWLREARTVLTDDAPCVGTLLTLPVVVEDAAEKHALHARTGAVAVDMETAWIAEVCTAMEVALLSLRVVSDAADVSFPVPGRILFDAERQRPRPAALSWYLLTHPARVGPFARFVAGLAPSRARLTWALVSLLTVPAPSLS